MCRIPLAAAAAHPSRVPFGSPPRQRPQSWREAAVRDLVLAPANKIPRAGLRSRRSCRPCSLRRRTLLSVLQALRRGASNLPIGRPCTPPSGASPERRGTGPAPFLTPAARLPSRETEDVLLCYGLTILGLRF